MTDQNPPNRQPWTAERIQRLREMVDADRPWIDIANALGLSSASSAFGAAVRHLGYQPRPYRKNVTVQRRWARTGEVL